jgi:hypothetical protein
MGRVALEIIRVADHDPATLQHALDLCRSLARDDPTNEGVRRAVGLLKRVTKFLGVPPPLFNVRTGVPGH